MVHYTVFNGSNNSENFEHFMHELINKIKGSATVAMDNYTVHKSRRVTDHFNERVKQMFLPPYSCNLNPIERLWNILKQRWRKVIISNPDGLEPNDTEERIKELIKSLDNEMVKRLSCSHIHSIIRCLKGEFV